MAKKNRTFRDLVGEEFDRVVGSLGWAADAEDLKIWLDLLDEPDVPLTTQREAWFLGLSMAVGSLAAALSEHLNPPGMRSVRREALFLAALIVCNACYGPKGRPCSRVKLEKFPEDSWKDIRDLFHTAYGSSGPPIANGSPRTIPDFEITIKFKG